MGLRLLGAVLLTNLLAPRAKDGLTAKQYSDFNQLVQRYRDLKILCFPCNQFGLQEPGRNDEILNGLKYVRPGHDFTPAYGVEIFGKLNVNGKTEHPLFTFLKEACPPTTTKMGSRSQYFWDEVKVTDITWNFEKFLVDKYGRPRYRFKPDFWKNGTEVVPYINKLIIES